MSHTDDRNSQDRFTTAAVEQLTRVRATKPTSGLQTQTLATLRVQMRRANVAEWAFTEGELRDTLLDALLPLLPAVTRDAAIDAATAALVTRVRPAAQ